MVESEIQNIEQILREGMLLGINKRAAIDQINTISSMISENSGKNLGDIIHSSTFNSLLTNLIEIDEIKERYPATMAPKLAYENILNNAKLAFHPRLYEVLVERGNLKYQREKAELLTQ